MIGKIKNLFGRSSDAVFAFKDGAIKYHNSAAARLIPGIGALTPGDILPVTALAIAEDYKGETTVAGQRVAVTASTLGGYRICVLSGRQTDARAETAELLTSAGVQLRNRLAVLHMAAVLLTAHLEDNGDRRLLDAAAMLHHSYYCILRLTDSLGDLGASLRNDAQFESAAFDLAALCREMTVTAAHFTRADIRFESAADSLLIRADRKRLEKLVLNLLANSLQSASGGGTVTVSVVTAGDRVVLSVSDSAGGIGGGVLPSVWSWYGAPKDLSERTGGIGLGLTIVQSIAREHGGSAVLETRSGEGTTVTVSLPIVTPEEAAPDEVGPDMTRLLTELSGVVTYDRYTHIYMD